MNQQTQRILGLLTLFVFMLPVSWPRATVQPQSHTGSTNQIGNPQIQPRPAFAADRVIVKLRPESKAQLKFGDREQVETQSIRTLLSGQAIQSAQQLFKRSESATTPETNLISDTYLLNLQKGSDVQAVVKSLAALPPVAWVEPDYQAYPVATSPNDPLFPDQWGLTSIEAPAAWDVTTGSAVVPIAILDSGVEFSHPDLSGKLWVNPGEIAGNGVDDDNNGYVDDVNGWDFVNNDPNPADDNGHGTQVAGIVAAATNNATGIAGVCWACRIMPVKVMQSGGVANYSDIAAGVLYAAQKGARVINISLGGYSDSALLKSAIQTAVTTYGAVVVAGAGNDNLDTPFYPAAYDQVLSVAGVDQTDAKANLSNYGGWVDVAAPAVSIDTTFMGGDYGLVDGTSFAAAFVSGVAGLLRSQNPTWSPDMVRAQIIQTADDIASLNPGFEGQLGSGRVNANQAVRTSAQPKLSFQSDSVDGVINGRPEPGSTVGLSITLHNNWADAIDIQATLSSSDSHVTILANSSQFGDIAAFGNGTSITPYRFSISAGTPRGYEIAFTLNVTSSGGYSTSIPFKVTTASGIQYVSGVISGNTSWTSDKVYIVNGNLLVDSGAQLTIEPGTMIKFDPGKILQINGSLVAIGLPDKRITFTSNKAAPAAGNWAGIQFNDSSIDAVTEHVQYVSGSTLQYATIEYATTGVLCANASPYLSHNLVRFNSVIGIEAGESAAYNDSNPIVISNEIRENASGLQTGNAITVTNNVIVGNSAWGIFADRGGRGWSAWITNNLIARNGTEGLGVWLNDNFTIANNTIIDNKIGIKIEAGFAPSTAFINDNNLIDSGQYDLVNETNMAVNVPGNWWGTTDTTQIGKKIYDFSEDFSLGIVNFTPVLTSPSSTAPAYVVNVDISPDTTLGIQTASFDVKFNRAMDQSTNPDFSFQSAKNGTWSAYKTANSGLPNNNVCTVAIGRDGTTWFGTDGGGAAHFDGYNWTVYNSANSGLPSDIGVCTIAIDTDGTAWFGTADGAAHLDGSNWTVYNPTNSGLPGNFINAIAIGSDGKPWFGTNGGGAAHFDGVNWTVYNADNSGLPNNVVRTIAIDKDDTPWFGTDGGGAAHFNGNNWTVYNSANSGLLNDYIQAIASNRDGSMWFSTYNDGVAKFNGTDWTLYDTSNSGLPNNVVWSINFDLEGLPWFGTDYGAAYFDGTNWSVYYTVNSGVPDNNVSKVAIDTNGSIWFATAGSGAAVLWNLPNYYPNDENKRWLNEQTYHATYDITALIPRGDYLINISEAVGTDQITIAPTRGYTFTVDYAGAIGDTTPPNAPVVTACAGETLGSLFAQWSASDPESSITLYSYAIGTTPGGSDVVNWTITTNTSFNRSNLNLAEGQSYYIAVKARNEGGLWSGAGVPKGVVPGSGVCTTNVSKVYLPLARR